MDYKVIITTGAVDHGGTDARVYIVLSGTSGSSGLQNLDNAKNNFEKGQVDEFRITCDDLGDLEYASIQHDNSGKYPGWYVDRIEIHSSAGQAWAASNIGWLRTKDAPYSLGATKKLSRI
jgi:hypothetical protein